MGAGQQVFKQTALGRALGLDLCWKAAEAALTSAWDSRLVGLLHAAHSCLSLSLTHPCPSCLHFFHSRAGGHYFPMAFSTNCMQEVTSQERSLTLTPLPSAPSCSSSPVVIPALGGEVPRNGAVHTAVCRGKSGNGGRSVYSNVLFLPCFYKKRMQACMAESISECTAQ